jgi:hypothetical protein
MCKSVIKSVKISLNIRILNFATYFGYIWPTSGTSSVRIPMHCALIQFLYNVLLHTSILFWYAAITVMYNRYLINTALY